MQRASASDYLLLPGEYGPYRTATRSRRNTAAFKMARSTINSLTLPISKLDLLNCSELGVRQVRGSQNIQAALTLGLINDRVTRRL
jgi:hypothetical protein